MNNTLERRAIPLDLIDVGPRLRAVDLAYVELIAASMRESGQKTPIEVRRSETDPGRYLLVAGGHRVAAATQAGLAELEAIVSDLTDDEAQLAEIDENLMRRELTPLDRAVFLSARKDVWLRLNPETGHGKSKKNKAQEESAGLHSFDKITAKRLGMDPSTIRRSIARARIPADVRAMIASHPVAESGAELDKLAGYPVETQRAIAACLTRPDKPARNIAGAHAEIVGPVRETAEAVARREFGALLSAWRKAGQRARKQFLEHLEMDGTVMLAPAKGRAA
ncbi:ParB/RepB/Spo0J family partition protein [Falsiroseomonas sp.]|uniref:ParB/RepB/Spo0J family partition protein n=1 Tax=Falsiroseomonas sp. TaxID=2870721 RepID=UPI0027237B1B|nr:ParB/RepB/Spo0J family partition protein [Falsiroseomonas sp.]MDO9499000.1 ParB/RepB/Spo0J family partition protein [Falsiroseomonas sp.]